MKEMDVSPIVAAGYIRDALDWEFGSEEAREALNWCGTSSAPARRSQSGGLPGEDPEVLTSKTDSLAVNLDAATVAWTTKA